MNAVVLLRAVTDRESTVETKPIMLDAPSIAALCQAQEWRRSGGGRVTGMAAGPESWEGAIREALALGLDAAERVATDAGETHSIAWTAAALAAAIPPDADFVFAGAPATDFGTGLLAAALAGVLDWPLISDAVRVVHVDCGLEAEVIAGPGRRRTYQTNGPAVISAASLAGPPVYAPLARRLAAARTAIAVREPDEAGLPPAQSTFAGYGPPRPSTRHLLKPSSGARPGDRLSQLMSGGPQRSGSKLSGDAVDLARQLADLLAAAGLVPR